MPKFSKASKSKLKTCHPDIQRLMNEVVKYYDCTIVDGHRDKERQDLYYAQGVSKVKYPNSRHNRYPSNAVDVAPYIKGKGLSWNTIECYVLSGQIIEIARRLKIDIRWGGDWDSDRDLTDQTFNDLVHFELR